jgi:hypothetical protein
MAEETPVYDAMGNQTGFVENYSTSSSVEKEEVFKRENNFQAPAIRDLCYPIVRNNNHYVKFYINVDEESRFMKEERLQATTIDNSDQNRLNGNNSSGTAVTTGVALGGAVMGASFAPDKIEKFMGGFKGKASSAVMAGVAGAVGGAAIGAGLGALAVDEFKMTKRLKRLNNSISLYTPAGISVSYDIGYSMTDDKLIDLAQKDQFESLGKALKTPLSSAAKLARIVATGGSDAVSNLSRTAINQKKDMLFKQVENRVFSFDYQFAPQSPDEAYEVADIIYTFKLFSHPEMIEGYGQFLFIYPAEFDIEYRFIDTDGVDRENEYLNKISSCVLERISVSYASNGSFQSLAKGEPIITNMSLRFREIETLHLDRIKKGF